MHEWVSQPALRHHMECVSAAMGAYARLLSPQHEERWRVAGLLHDFDYEKHPTAQEHPFVGVAHLRTLGVDEEIITAILGHASDRTGVHRFTPMAKALFAVDELCGFIVACAKVRPQGLADLSAASVIKKLQNRSFAAAVSREDVEVGSRELCALSDFDHAKHIDFCIQALRDMPSA